jgi:GntR family transcriptional regulator/MocR family aminotransferase
MPVSKIQSRGQFSVDRRRDEPLSLQIVRQLQDAIERGRVPAHAVLPSSRALARALGVSRNTVLTAYDELKARGLITGRRGAGMRVARAAAVKQFDVPRVVRDAQYPLRTIVVHDPDGNPLTVVY